MHGTIKKIAVCGEDITLAEKLKVIVLNAFARDSGVFRDVRNLHHWVEDNIISIVVNNEVGMQYEISALAVEYENSYNALRNIITTYDCCIFLFAFAPAPSYDMAPHYTEIQWHTTLKVKTPALSVYLNTRNITGNNVQSIEQWLSLQDIILQMLKMGTPSPDFEVENGGIFEALGKIYRAINPDKTEYLDSHVSFIYDTGDNESYIQKSSVFTNVLLLFLSVDSVYSYRCLYV